MRVSIPIRDGGIRLTKVNSRNGIVCYGPSDVRGKGTMFAISTPVSFTVISLGGVGGDSDGVSGDGVLGSGAPVRANSVVLGATVLVTFYSLTSVLVFEEEGGVKWEGGRVGRGADSCGGQVSCSYDCSYQ